MKDNKRFFSAIVAFSLVFLFAVTFTAGAQIGAGPESLDDITDIVTTVVNWFQIIVLILGVMMIVWAGLTWMTAGDSAEKRTEARQRLIWGLVGIGVALFAGVAQTFVENLIS